MKNLVRACATSLFVLVAACGPAQIGESCSDSSGCAVGLMCIPSGGQHIVSGMPTCDATVRLCSAPCATDADCTPVGPGLICIHDCFAGSCLQGHH